jgi:carbon monoxide dehydrogenase subunit G
MKLTNDLRVSASMPETWRTLLDVPRVARALPGATIDAEPVDGAFRGRLKIKLGPVTAEYTGRAQLQDVDEDEHIASFHVTGREARGR